MQAHVAGRNDRGCRDPPCDRREVRLRLVLVPAAVEPALIEPDVVEETAAASVVGIVAVVLVVDPERVVSHQFTGPKHDDPLGVVRSGVFLAPPVGVRPRHLLGDVLGGGVRLAGP